MVQKRGSHFHLTVWWRLNVSFKKINGHPASPLHDLRSCSITLPGESLKAEYLGRLSLSSARFVNKLSPPHPPTHTSTPQLSAPIIAIKLVNILRGGGGKAIKLLKMGMKLYADKVVRIQRIWARYKLINQLHKIACHDVTIHSKFWGPEIDLIKTAIQYLWFSYTVNTHFDILNIITQCIHENRAWIFVRNMLLLKISTPKSPYTDFCPQ